jgi:ornithine--oxo-acid transaminase
LVERSHELGSYALERLRAKRSPLVREVRGRGLWIGIELHAEAGGARRYCEQLRDEGMLCKETHVHVIRVAPPLVIGREELDWALERIEQTLEME